MRLTPYATMAAHDPGTGATGEVRRPTANASVVIKPGHEIGLRSG
jgi:hypothetical protein